MSLLLENQFETEISEHFAAGSGQIDVRGVPSVWAGGRELAEYLRLVLN